MEHRQIPFFDFDLSQTAEQRWKPIIDSFQNQLPALRQTLRGILAQYGMTVTALKPVYWLTPASKIIHYDEICYIAERIGMEPFEILLVQLIYETSSACSVGVFKVQGQELFFRTMDWPMLFLKDITIGLNVQKNGVLIAKVTSWLGYVGFLTATSIDASTSKYTIAINYRRTQPMTTSALFNNFIRTLSMNWPIGYLIRYVIESRLSIHHAEWLLGNANLISPTYITLYVPKIKTVIFTRDPDRTVDKRNTDLVQTNCDCDKNEPDILWSIDRRRLMHEVESMLHGTNDIKVERVLAKLMRNPIINNETIYVHYQYGDQYVSMV